MSGASRRISEPEEGEYPATRPPSITPSTEKEWVNPLDRPGPSRSQPALPPKPKAIFGKERSPTRPMSSRISSRESHMLETSSSQVDRYRVEERGEEQRSRSPSVGARGGTAGGGERSSRYEADHRRQRSYGVNGTGSAYDYGYDGRERFRGNGRMDQYIPSYGNDDVPRSRRSNERYDYDDRGDWEYDERDGRSWGRGYRDNEHERDRAKYQGGFRRYEEDYSRHRRRSRSPSWSRSRSRSRDLNRKRRRKRSPEEPTAEEGEISEHEEPSRITVSNAVNVPEPNATYQPIKIKNRPTKRISDINVMDTGPPPTFPPPPVSAPDANGQPRPPSPTEPPLQPPVHPPTPPCIPTPPPPSERPPTPPPPPPATNDIKRITTTPKGPSSSYQPRVPINKALDITKAQGKYDAHGDRADGSTSVPHAPNRNLQNPPTRPTTPAAKAEVVATPESRSKLFTRPTADEELRDLNKSFVGTTTLAAYDLGDKLGEGTFGVVTKGIEIATKRHIALKKLITHNARDGVSVTTVREIKILKALSHPNIVEIIDMVVERVNPADRTRRGEVFMVFPYMDHDLCGLLSNSDFVPSHSMSKLFMRQILQGMDYIHANNFIHRDIKTANILVDRRGEIKIADFGLARSWTHDELMPKHLAMEYTNMVVTRWYRAPELLLGDRHYGPAVDMWSLGCVLGELYNRIPILQGESDRDQLFKIFGKVDRPSEETFPGWDKLPGFPESVGYAWDKVPEDQPLLDTAQKWGIDRGGADLMMQLLRLNPVKRLTANEALDHPWFWVSPKPAVCSKVESSHEMTQKIKNEPRRPIQQQSMPGIRQRQHPHSHQHQSHPHAQQHYPPQQSVPWNAHRPIPHAQPQMGVHGQPINPYAQAVTNPYGGGPPRQQFANGTANNNGYGQGPPMGHQPYPHQNGHSARQNMGMGGPPTNGLPVRPSSQVPAPPFKLAGNSQKYVPPPPFQLAGGARHPRPPHKAGGIPSGPASMDNGLDAGSKRDQGLPYD